MMVNINSDRKLKKQAFKKEAKKKQAFKNCHYFKIMHRERYEGALILFGQYWSRLSPSKD